MTTAEKKPSPSCVPDLKNKPEDPIEKLLWMMACLRNPDGGCPWDLEQTYKTIAPHTIEEAYEVVDAIENGSIDDLKEELGDLLLQVVFHAQMAAENGDFTFLEVADALSEKMISRHPHVFGDESAEDWMASEGIWEAQKDKEKGARESALDGITLGLPALLRAQKLQKRAARVGFEWKDAKGAYVKLEEELDELKEAVDEADKAHMEEELGDVLFCVVNYARMMGINSEEALRKANDKFNRRFRGLEDDLKAQGTKPQGASLKLLLEVWDKQKEK
jgi:ATP diphosphatase